MQAEAAQTVPVVNKRDPRAQLDYYKSQIRDCQQRASDTLQAEVELGAYLELVRDMRLYELEAERDIFTWAKKNHDIRRTRVKTLIKVGTSFRPDQVEGRKMSVDCLYQIALVSPYLHDPLLDLAVEQRITSPAVMRRCSQAAAASFEEMGEEDEAMQAARAARSPQVEYGDQLNGAVRRVERLLDRLDQADGPAQAGAELLAEMQARLESLAGRVRTLRKVDAPAEPVPVEVKVEVQPGPGPEPEPEPEPEPGLGDEFPEDDDEEEEGPLFTKIDPVAKEQEEVRKLTSPLREIWLASDGVMRPYPEFLYDLLGYAVLLSAALADGKVWKTASLAREIAESPLRRLAPGCPLQLYCRLLMATYSVYCQRAPQPVCDVQDIVARCERQPDLLPPEVQAHALHMAGAVHAMERRSEEAGRLLLLALRRYDELGGVETMRLFHLLTNLGAVLEALGDPRAEEIKARCREVEARPGNWRIWPEKEPKQLFPFML